MPVGPATQDRLCSAWSLEFLPLTLQASLVIVLERGLLLPGFIPLTPGS